jgi:peptidylprolyl isomerase
MTMRLCLAMLIVLTCAACTPKSDSELGPDGTVPPPPDVAAPPADAQRTPSGLASRMLRVGFGDVRPSPRSQALGTYTGWTPDGKMFDSSLRTGGPIVVSLDRVIPGWTEGLQLMVPGEKRRFWIPGHLAYDNLDMPDAPKGMLVFDVELLEIR